MVSINEILISITLLLSFANIACTQLTYNNATCNGPYIGSLRVTSRFVDDINFDPNDIDGTTQFTEEEWTTNPYIGDPRFAASAIDPDTSTIYTIFTVYTTPCCDNDYYIGNLDNPLTISNVQKISTGNSTFYTGMTFDCDGNLYAIEFETRDIYYIDPLTGEATEFANGGGDCGGGVDCGETFSYNWDDNQLYRISSSEENTPTTADLYIQSLDDPASITQLLIDDPDGLCPNTIEGIEYIGNDLFLVSCSDVNAIRLLDISNNTKPIIKYIDSTSISLPSTSEHGVGLIPSLTGNDLCTAQCPTDTPTSTPTTSPPTSTPTTSPIEQPCPTCPYNISLIEISPVSLSSNCPTVSPTPTPTGRTIWNKRSASSDSSVAIARTVRKVNRYYTNSGSNVKVINRNRNNNNVDSRDSSSDSRRRQLLSDSDSDSSEDIDRCFSDGSELIFVGDLCNNDNGFYDSSSSGSDSSSSINLRTDEFLSQTICVTYNINDIVANGTDCGDINNIFLGLCENENTDFDSSLLGIGDIDSIISDETFEDGNNVLTAIGARNSADELGVSIQLNDMDAEMFSICFENVTVTTAFNQTKDSLDIAQGYINYTNTSGVATLCPSQGLPCLNFFFGCEEDLIGPEEGFGLTSRNALSESRNCDCDHGMTALTLRYDGPIMADMIVGSYGGRRVRFIPGCIFYNVKPGDTITCTSENLRRGIFGRNTNFAVHYSEEDEDIRRRNLLQSIDDDYDELYGDCFGKVRTNCKSQIIGNTLRQCNDLIIVSHMDGDGALCDEEILALQTNNNANALINNGEYIYNPLNILNELDPYIKWTLICIFITFIILIFVSIYVCFSYKCKKQGHENEEDNDAIINDEEGEEIDVIASAIAMSKHNGNMENKNNEKGNEEMHQLNKIWDIDDDNNNIKHTFEVTS